MDFGSALNALKYGNRVARAGWNGKGMWLALVKGADWRIVSPPADMLGHDKAPFITMKTADNKIVPWLASQTDILAEDWEIVA